MIEEQLQEIVQVFESIRQMLSDSILVASNIITDAYKRGNKVLLCGNGGSAADAQHIAAELLGRFYKDRAPLPAIALHANSSYMTAVANDYGYEEVFSRAVKAFGRPGDVLIAISTSGNSDNVIQAVKVAKDIGMRTIALTGASGGILAHIADVVIRVPSNDTPRIQEGHIAIGHIICSVVEQNLFGGKHD